MLATSMRQPSSPRSQPRARRPSRRRRTDGGRARPRSGRASAATGCRARRRSRARRRCRTGRTTARGWPGRAAPRRNQSWWSPVWLVVRSPISRSPRACTASISRSSAVVAAEQRVDAVEGHRVVAVVGPGLEDRGQVDHRRAEGHDVVEVRGDAVERAAVAAGTARRGPCARPGRPSRPGCAQPGSARAGLGAGEPVGEDLVADLVGHPVRQPVRGADPEVAGVGDVAAVHARRVQPAVVRRARARPGSGTTSPG